MAQASQKNSSWDKPGIHGNYPISEKEPGEGRIRLRFMSVDRPPVELFLHETLLPGAAGVFSVLAGHTSMLSALIPGAIEVYNEKEERDFFAVSGGFAVIDNDTITILTEAWEHAKEIDVARAEEAQERAEIQIKKATHDTDVSRAEIALARALARIQAHSHEGY